MSGMHSLGKRNSGVPPDTSSGRLACSVLEMLQAGSLRELSGGTPELQERAFPGAELEQ
jgi:hypothetical protein